MASVEVLEVGKKKPAGWFGPSEALTVLYMKKSISLRPKDALKSQ